MTQPTRASVITDKEESFQAFAELRGKIIYGVLAADLRKDESSWTGQYEQNSITGPQSSNRAEQNRQDRILNWLVTG